MLMKEFHCFSSLQKDADTRHQTTLREIGSQCVDIYSDEWVAYRCLTNDSYVHEVINYEENYTDSLRLR